MREPITTIVRNAGIDAATVVEKVLAKEDVNYGFDALNAKYVDMVSAGIIDPTKVIRTALQVMSYHVIFIFSQRL